MRTETRSLKQTVRKATGRTLVRRLVAAAGVAALATLIAEQTLAGASPATTFVPGLAAPAAALPTPTAHDFSGQKISTRYWDAYKGPGNAGIGTQSPSAVHIADGVVTITGDKTTGVTGGACMCGYGGLSQLYGHWEIRARTQAGSGWNSVLILWPSSTAAPHHEIDIAEMPDGSRTSMWMTLHYTSHGAEVTHKVTGNFSGWNIYGIDWAADHLDFTVNGKTAFSTTDTSIIPHTPMFLTAQLNEGEIPNWTPAPDSSTPTKVEFLIDWVKIWQKPFAS